MTREEREQKAELYDNLIRESDKYQRLNSKLKAEHVGNIPADVQEQIRQNDVKIASCVKRLEDLMR